MSLFELGSKVVAFDLLVFVQVPESAETKYYQLGNYSNRSLFSHGFGGQKFKFKMLAGVLLSLKPLGEDPSSSFW